MKNKIFNKIITIIKKNNNDINDEQLEIVLYGLESIYLTMTKIVVILILSYLMGIFKEAIYTLFFYNFIRLFAFGMHAKKSSQCLIFSLIFFVFVPYIVSIIYISPLIKIICSIVAFILIIIYAPADTEKRPLINKKKRIRFKILSIICSFVLLVLIFLYKDYEISSYMFLGFIDGCIVILPITYKMFGLSYNNYKTYKEVW